MARPLKKGLDYLPLNNDIFEDDKLFDVQNEYGPLGEVIYIRLLCLVNKHGYYYRFDSLDKLAAMMIKSVGNRWAKDKKTVKEVILYLAKCNLFSSELMQRNVITSRGIQKRYLLAVERRQSKIEEFNLLEKNDFHEGFESVPENDVSVTETCNNGAETIVNISDNATKESKEKKSKLKESKEVTAGKSPDSSSKIDYNCIFELFNKICKSYPKITAYSEDRKKAIRERLESGYTVDDFKTVFEKAENSDFLKGNNRNWSANFDWLIKDANIAKVLDGNYDDRSSNQQKEYSFDIEEYKVLINDFGDEESR